MTPKELADIRKTDADAAGVYIDRGVIAPEEERGRIARNPESGYGGLDLDIEITNPNLMENDNDEEVSRHDVPDGHHRRRLLLDQDGLAGSRPKVIRRRQLSTTITCF